MASKAAGKRAGRPENISDLSAAAEDELGKIKDIILGADRERLDRSLAGLNDKLQQTIEALEARLTAGISAVGDAQAAAEKAYAKSLEAERTTREKMTGKIEATLERLDQAIRKVKSEGSEDLKQIKAMLATIEGDLTDGQRDLTDRMDRGFDELSANKTDAESLADLFADLAAQLRGNQKD
ncbi:MAG: hypothetical protein WBO47_03630 [Gammaproteobacteria bacterium]